MIEHLKFPKLSVFAKVTAIALFIGLSTSPLVSAGEFGTAKIKIFTFAETSTEKAMQSKDYDRVIDMSQRVIGHFGYHDLVNLCASYAFKGQYDKASRACDRAVRYRTSILFRRSNIKGDHWVAYANRAVVSTLKGNTESARRDLATAQRKGGDVAALGHNLAVIDGNDGTVGVELSAVQ